MQNLALVLYGGTHSLLLTILIRVRKHVLVLHHGSVGVLVLDVVGLLHEILLLWRF